MRYYVYILLDNRYEGNYDNEYCRVEYRPFYVGKGDSLSKNKKDRHLVHYDEVNKFGKICNPHKFNKIKKLLDEGYKPKFVIAYKDDDEQKVLEVESKLIAFYGKSKDGGYLTNIADGGKGGNLFRFVEGLQEKLNKINSEKWSGKNNPNYGKNKEETFSHNYKKIHGKHWNHGKLLTDEHKFKLKEIRYGKLPIVEMICPTTFNVIDKLKTVDAIKKYKLNPVLFYRSLNEGGRHKNFYWKYEDKDLILPKTKRIDYVKPERKPKESKKIFFKENIDDEPEICFNSIEEASQKTGFCVEVIRRKCRANNFTFQIFRYENKDYLFDIKEGKKRKIMSIDDFGYKNIYESASEAAKNIQGANISTIISVCKGKRKKHKNLIFKYI